MACDCYVLQYGVERCMGTKKMECCYCHGDMAKCTFYPEKRKKEETKMMNTAEMWLAAQKDGKTYVSNDMRVTGDIRYSAKEGIGISPVLMCYINFDDIMNLKWHEATISTMSRKDAEEKLGVKIVD